MLSLPAIPAQQIINPRRTRARPRRTLNWIRDNGIGISHEAQAKLFRSFTQLGPVRVPGHGLGLAIVRSIVEKLGSQVGVETEVGRCSQFFFTSPARL